MIEFQVGKNIRSLRCKRQINQEDLAETMGVALPNYGFLPLQKRLSAC